MSRMNWSRSKNSAMFARWRSQSPGEYADDREARLLGYKPNRIEVDPVVETRLVEASALGTPRAATQDSPAESRDSDTAEPSSKKVEARVSPNRRRRAERRKARSEASKLVLPEYFRWRKQQVRIEADWSMREVLQVSIKFRVAFSEPVRVSELGLSWGGLRLRGTTTLIPELAKVVQFEFEGAVGHRDARRLWDYRIPFKMDLLICGETWPEGSYLLTDILRFPKKLREKLYRKFDDDQGST